MVYEIYDHFFMVYEIFAVITIKLCLSLNYITVLIYIYPINTVLHKAVCRRSGA
jgi:hypothetical protein